MKITLAGLALAVLILSSPAAWPEGALSPEKRQVIAEVDALEAQIVDMSMELWNFSEIALREHQSAEYLADILEAEGFTVERGVADMPTAFVAEWGSGGPVIGIRGWLIPLRRRISSLPKGSPAFTTGPLVLPFSTDSKLSRRRSRGAALPE